MTTIDLILEARTTYLASARSRKDWIRYLTVVERLEAQRDGRACHALDTR